MNYETLNLTMYLVDAAGNYSVVDTDEYNLATDGTSCEYIYWDCGITRIEQYTRKRDGVTIGVMVATGLRN